MDMNKLTTVNEMANGNPGAITFLAEAYRLDPFGAEDAMQRMRGIKITGDKLYMLWSDCCDRDTDLTLKMMSKCTDEQLFYYLNYENGRGIHFSLDDLK